MSAQPGPRRQEPEKPPVTTILPPDEWQFWKIPPEERRAAALYELERQAVIETYLKGGAPPRFGPFAWVLSVVGLFPPPISSQLEFWTPSPANRQLWPASLSSYWGSCWLRESEETKSKWNSLLKRRPLYGEPTPLRWKPQTISEWAKALPERDPWFVEDCHINDAAWKLWNYIPTVPAPEDPPNTIARRRLPTIHKGARTNEAEILCALVINKDASRGELVNAFKEWLEAEGVGTNHRKKGQKETDAPATLTTIALRRLFLASSDRTRVCFWEPLRGQKWKYANGTTSAFFQFPNASGESSIRDDCRKRFEKLTAKLKGLNG